MLHLSEIVALVQSQSQSSGSSISQITIGIGGIMIGAGLFGVGLQLGQNREAMKGMRKAMESFDRRLELVEDRLVGEGKRALH